MPPLAHAPRPLALLVLGAVAIGFAPLFVRLAETDPVATALFRMLLALPVLALWFHCSPAPPGAPRRALRAGDHLRLAGAGALFAADLATWHWSITLTSVANATLLANFAPVFVTLGAWLWLGERVRARFVAGLVLGLGGAALLMGDSLRFAPGALAGDGLGLLTAVFYAGYLLSVSRLRREFATATIMLYTGAVTAALLLPAALLSAAAADAGPLLPLTLYGWAVLLALALVSHVGGQSLIAYALAHLPAPFSALTLLLQPVVAALLAWLLLAEPLRALQAAGGAVVMAAIWLARPRGRRG